MPYRVVENAAGCPSSKSIAVRKVGGSRNIGCHASREAAQKQVAALYAAEASLKHFNQAVELALESTEAAELALAAIYERAMLAQATEIAGRLEALSIQAAGFIPPSEAELVPSFSETEREALAQAQAEAADRINEVLLIPLGLAFLSAAVLEVVQFRALASFEDQVLLQLRALVENGLREGLTVAEVSEAILTSFRGTSPSTAEMLARTQITALVNEASLQAAREIATSTRIYKRWETVRDNRVRPAHARAQGQTRPLDAPFDVGGYSLMYPGDPAGPMDLTANCRCVLTYTKSLPLTAAGFTFGGELMSSTMFSDTFARLERDAQLVIVLGRWLHAHEALGVVTASASDGGPPWKALLVAENSVTPDRRMIAGDSLDHRELPLPLMALFETGPGGHEGAKLAGRIDVIERDGDHYLGEGVIDSGGEAGAELMRLREAGMPLGVSVDLAIHDKEMRAKDDPMGAALEDEAALEAYLGGTGVLVITKATILGATVAPMQAIDEANEIEILVADEEGLPQIVRAHGGFITSEGTPFVVTMTPQTGGSWTTNVTITASGQFPLKPKAEVFERPDLRRATPLAYDEETGRVWGHLAPWEGCHIGWSTCVPPPRSSTDYAYFHTGLMETEDGGFIPVGKLMFCQDGGTHADADPRMSAREAAKHYDDHTKVAGYVRAGEDEHGIWLAGCLRPGLSEEELHFLRLNPPSGDWRPVRGLPTSELIASFSVPVGGYPMPHAEMLLVASAGMPDAMGSLIIHPGWVEEEFSETDIARMVRVLHARAHGYDALGELAHSGE